MFDFLLDGTVYVLVCLIYKLNLLSIITMIQMIKHNVYRM